MSSFQETRTEYDALNATEIMKRSIQKIIAQSMQGCISYFNKSNETKVVEDVQQNIRNDIHNVVVELSNKVLKEVQEITTAITSVCKPNMSFKDRRYAEKKSMQTVSSCLSKIKEQFIGAENVLGDTVKDRLKEVRESIQEKMSEKIADRIAERIAETPVMAEDFIVSNILDRESPVGSFILDKIKSVGRGILHAGKRVFSYIKEKAQKNPGPILLIVGGTIMGILYYPIIVTTIKVVTWSLVIAGFIPIIIQICKGIVTPPVLLSMIP